MIKNHSITNADAKLLVCGDTGELTSGLCMLDRR